MVVPANFLGVFDHISGKDIEFLGSTLTSGSGSRLVVVVVFLDYPSRSSELVYPTRPKYESLPSLVGPALFQKLNPESTNHVPLRVAKNIPRVILIELFEEDGSVKFWLLPRNRIKWQIV